MASSGAIGGGEKPESATEVNLLGLVLDMGPESWRSAVGGNAALLTQCMDSVLAFANSYLALNATNRIVVLACDHQNCRFLYPITSSEAEPRVVPKDGQFEVLADLDVVVKRELKNLIVLQDSNDTLSVLEDSLIPGALGKSLCFINRVSKSLTMGEKLLSRILIVTPSQSLTSGYMAFMNAFFSAQKLGVVIDTCLVGTEDCSLLKQGSDITGGMYFKLSAEGLLESLFYLFLPGVKERQQMSLPEPPPVDYRASCFCHRNLIDVGYVCSVCLSVFCRFSPICSTCHAVFNLAPLATPASNKAKRRKVGADNL